MDLATRFTATLVPYIAHNKVAQLWEQLSNAYETSFRKYHNLTHLEEIFGYYDIYQGSIQNKEALILAIFYHDFVYEVWKKNNEEESAKKVIELLKQNNFPLKQLQTIEDLIICTKHHTSFTADQSFIIDFDLAILGQSEKNYGEYTQQIRKEYKIVPELIYKKERKKVLQHFLDKKTIFQTTIFQSQFEVQARINLNKELQQL